MDTIGKTVTVGEAESEMTSVDQLAPLRLTGWAARSVGELIPGEVDEQKMGVDLHLHHQEIEEGEPCW